MKTLFQITDELVKLNELLDETGGEIPANALDQLNAYMDGLAQDEANKLNGYVGLIKQIEMEETAAKAEAEQWQTKARVRGNRIDWLMARLKQHLEATGRKEIKTTSGYKIVIQKNGGSLPLILDAGVSPETVPAEFTKTVVSIDNGKIKDALNEGKEVPFAKFGERVTHLRIR